MPSPEPPAELAFTAAGTGPPLLLLAGLGCDRRMFAPQLQALGAEFQLLAPDIRGTGRSPKLRVPVRQIIDAQVHDLVRLLDGLSIERAHVCGVSYGGALAIRLAALHPDRVDRLVLVDTMSHTCGGGVEAFTVRVLGRILLPLSYSPKLLAEVSSYGLRRWPQAADIMREVIRDYRAHEAVKQRLALDKLDQRSTLPRIYAPTLCLAGGEDQRTSRRMRTIAEAMPSGRYIEIADSMDPSNLCQPAEFNRLLVEHLKRR